jgi:hypothetical protein
MNDPTPHEVAYVWITVACDDCNVLIYSILNGHFVRGRTVGYGPVRKYYVSRCLPMSGTANGSGISCLSYTIRKRPARD